MLQIVAGDSERYKVAVLPLISPPPSLLGSWLYYYYYCNSPERALDGITVQENEHDRGRPPPVDAVYVAKVYKVNICIMQYIRVAVLFKN